MKDFLVKHIFAIIFILQATLIQAQIITHGPLVGGVTPNSARIYIATDIAAEVCVEVSKDILFTDILNYCDQTTEVDYLCKILDINGLDSYTNYFYRVKIDGNPGGQRNKFRTFPDSGKAGYYKMVVGSCNYNNGPGGGQGNPNYKNDLMFQSMVDFDPDIFIHLGDWNYPPSAFGWQYNIYPDLVAQSFKLRYSDYNMKTYIEPNMPIDYIYDDDYSQNGNAGWTYPTISTTTLPNGDTKYILKDEPLTPGIREGARIGYFKNFPGYQQVDTSAIHHFIQLGNVDIFMTDSRGAKSPVHEAFKYNSLLNSFSFNPGPNHSTLGTPQREWLLNGLENSKADWKIIGSGVIFNKKFGDFMDLVLAGQLFDKSLVEYATSIGYMWPGYPKDQRALLDLVKNKPVKNVVMLSGDSHSTMIDDGKNAGVPELSASGLSADDEGYFNGVIDSLLESLGLSVTTKDFLWNAGGNGVANHNYSDTYGTVEVFYCDSIRLRVVDEFLQELASLTIEFNGVRNCDTSVSTGNSQIHFSKEPLLLIYPNPAQDRIKILMNNEWVIDEQDITYTIEDLSGKITRSGTIPYNKVKDWVLYLNDFSTGLYLIQFNFGQQNITRKFYVSQ